MFPFSCKKKIFFIYIHTRHRILSLYLFIMHDSNRFKLSFYVLQKNKGEARTTVINNEYSKKIQQKALGDNISPWRSSSDKNKKRILRQEQDRPLSLKTALILPPFLTLRERQTIYDRALQVRPRGLSEDWPQETEELQPSPIV